MNEYRIELRPHEGDAYITLRWSPCMRADKYAINAKVPAQAGLAELFWRDASGRLSTFDLFRSWYGGLRANLRERSDPELERDGRRLGILLAHKGRIYCRYSLSESDGDLADALYFFAESSLPGQTSVAPSGRYARIYLNEVKEVPTT